jgi:hypothetical protein
VSQLTGPQAAAVFVAVNPSQARWGTTMGGIALAESGGWTNAIAGTSPGGNPSVGTDGYGGSYGLWQINGSHYGITSPVPPSQGGPLPATNWIMSMFNAYTNAKEAGSLLDNGAGIGAWTGDPVGTVAIQNGGPLTEAQVNQALSGRGVSYSGSSSLTGLSLGGSGTAALTSATSAGGGCNPTPTSPMLHRPGGCCGNVDYINWGSVHFLSECQVDAFLGGAIMVGGAIITMAGLVVTLTSIGLRGRVSTAVEVIPGVGPAIRAAKRAPAVRSQNRSADQASQRRITEAEQRAAAKRYGNAKPASFGFQPGPGDDAPL